jgi:hypothetical protein
VMDDGSRQRVSGKERKLAGLDEGLSSLSQSRFVYMRVSYRENKLQ